MSTVIIILVLVVVVVVAIGTMLGRISHEVESARDTEYVELEGNWVRYNVIGGGPPVLLVHGWLSSSRIWEQLARRLAQRFTVYTLDVTGFGESDKPTEGYGARNGSRLLYAFCAHFGLSRTAVIGHDLSGPMAVKLAADHPDIVGRLVLVAAPTDEEQIDLPTLLWLTTLPVLGPIFYALGRVLRPLRKLWMRPFVFDPGDLPEELVEDAGRSTPAAAGKTYSVTRHEISGGRVARQARIIKVPILLVAGEDDRIVDPRAVGDWGQYTDQAEIVLLDRCGHLPMAEVPAEFSARVLAFLTGDSRYLEYVKEVPQPATQEEPAEDPEEQREEPPPAAEPGAEPEPGRAAISAEEESTAERSTAESTDFGGLGDISWDFSPKKPSTPRRNRLSTPRPEARAVEDEGTRPASPPARRSTPPPEEKAAENGSAENRTTEERAAEDSGRQRAERPEGSRRSSNRSADRPTTGEKSGSGRIPEFPGDLFQWSKEPDEYSANRRRRRRSTGDDNKDEE